MIIFRQLIRFGILLVKNGSSPWELHFIVVLIAACWCLMSLLQPALKHLILGEMSSWSRPLLVIQRISHLLCLEIRYCYQSSLLCCSTWIMCYVNLGGLGEPSCVHQKSSTVVSCQKWHTILWNQCKGRNQCWTSFPNNSTQCTGSGNSGHFFYL